jgi:hypothetical protein
MDAPNSRPAWFVRLAATWLALLLALGLWQGYGAWLLSEARLVV